MSGHAELVSLATLVARPGARDALRTALEALVAPTRAEPGALDYVLFEQTDSPGTFVMREAFRSHDDLLAHQGTSHYRAFAARADELLTQPLELTFLTRISD